jgi:hypothetical protein
MARQRYTFSKNIYSTGEYINNRCHCRCFEMDVTHSAVQAQCFPSYQLASSLLHQHQQVVWSLQYFSGLAVFFTQTPIYAGTCKADNTTDTTA